MHNAGEVVLVSRVFRVVRFCETGSDGRELVKDVVQHPGAVAILPLLDDGRICLIRNFRVAVGRTLIELPAGTLDAGEDPATTARRELVEETGYRAARIEKLREFVMSPGILDERMHLFVASGLSPGAAALEPGEKIEPLVVAWDEALRMARDGTIEDAKTLVGLFHYDDLLRRTSP